jgi:hypothetical protein
MRHAAFSPRCTNDLEQHQVSKVRTTHVDVGTGADGPNAAIGAGGRVAPH